MLFQSLSVTLSVWMSTTSQTVSVTDSAGNVYADAVAQAQSTDGHQIHLFYAKNVKWSQGAAVSHHRTQPQLIEPVPGHCEANQALAMRSHEINRLGRDHLGGHRQVAFILAMLIVDNDDHASFPNIAITDWASG